MTDTILQDCSPIYNLSIYNKITPLVLISLSSFYVSVLIIRYLKWMHRKRKRKHIRSDRQKLETFWRKQVLKYPVIQRPQLAHDSTATLVVMETPYLEHQIKKSWRSRNADDQKRRQRIWQWSVAMGYCRYHHGDYLDTMINRLLQKRRNTA